MCFCCLLSISTFICACCIELVRNKDHPFNDLIWANLWWRVLKIIFNVYGKIAFGSGNFLAVWCQVSYFTSMCFQSLIANERLHHQEDWSMWWCPLACVQEILPFLLSNFTQTKRVNDSNKDKSWQDLNFILTTWCWWTQRNKMLMKSLISQGC